VPGGPVIDIVTSKKNVFNDYVIYFLGSENMFLGDFIGEKYSHFEKRIFAFNYQPKKLIGEI
jgi:hypothetical protein